MKKFVDSQNTTSRPDQLYGKVIGDIAKEGVCPFCAQNIKRFHSHPLTVYKYWLVTDNMYPYKPVLNHRLLIYTKHIEHICELTKEAWSELDKILKEEAEKRSIKGGTLMLRFGETKFTGASVTHLHAHLIQSDPDSPEYDKEKGLITRVG